jgi:beta-galactosidase/beta-glucuronidase
MASSRFPEMRTIEASRAEDRTGIFTPVMLATRKNNEGNAIIHDYLLKDYPEPKDFASFLYVSQVLQAEGIKIGAEHFRRSRPETMGSIFWQLNDCWPVASWSSIDYYGRWKALQYYARRFYAPILVSPHVEDGSVKVYIVSDKTRRAGHAARAADGLRRQGAAGRNARRGRRSARQQGLSRLAAEEADRCGRGGYFARLCRCRAAFLRSACNPHHAAFLQLRNLSHNRTHSTCRRSNHHCLARFRLPNVQQSHIRRESRHAQHTQRIGRLGRARSKIQGAFTVCNRELLPAVLAQDPVANCKSRYV